MFDNRINFSIDVYQRQSFDLISIIRTSGIGGESDKAANYADMESKGAELLIGGNIKKNRIGAGIQTSHLGIIPPRSPMLKTSLLFLIWYDQKAATRKVIL